MFITPKCGGIKLNADTFEIRNGIVTVAGAHSDDPLTETTTPCGQPYDALIFETVKHNGKWLLTSAGVDVNIPLANIIRTSCGIDCDGRFFSKDENDVLDFTDRHLLEVLVSPVDAPYTITVALTAEPDTPIEPFEGLDNVYPLDTLEEEYTVTVTAEGYDTSEQEVTADQDHVLQVELTPSAAG